LNPRFQLPNKVILEKEEVDIIDFYHSMKNELTPERLARIEEIATLKTFDVAVITENIFDRGNLNAIMRSSENFGFTKFYSYEAKQIKKANPNSQRTTTGADKWLEYKSLNNYTSDISSIKAEGYKIIATSLDKQAKPLNQIDLVSQPIALVFGNEKDGISDQMKSCADETCIIENAGFTQSLNVSVAAAIVMHQVFQARKKCIKETGLNKEEVELLTAHYLFRSFQKYEYRMYELLKLYQLRRSETTL
jgi:tRNA (guanosine-2'-O-)-methyltransferase